MDRRSARIKVILALLLLQLAIFAADTVRQVGAASVSITPDSFWRGHLPDFERHTRELPNNIEKTALAALTDHAGAGGAGKVGFAANHRMFPLKPQRTKELEKPYGEDPGAETKTTRAGRVQTGESLDGVPDETDSTGE